MQLDLSARWFDSVRWLAPLALVAIVFSSQTANAATKVVTDADKGGEVHLKVGDTLEVRLKSNPTTGYMWYVHKESMPLLKLAHQSQTDPAEQAPENAQQQSVGRPVFQVFTFEPRRAGDGVLKLHYVRSWDKPAPDEEQFTIHVFIE